MSQAELVNCVAMREKILSYLIERVSTFKLAPKLTIVSIGHDDASEIYIRNKVRTANLVGIRTEHVTLPKDITQEEAKAKMKELGEDEDTHALMLQLPIPNHLDADELINMIPQVKDVDGLTDMNMGLLVNNHNKAIEPATARGVVYIMLEVVQQFAGIDVAIVNRSRLIGKPLQAMLTNRNCTVTLCHSHTENLREKTRLADVVILGIGSPQYFETSFFRDNQLIIDCGINRDKNGKVCGDVDVKDIQRNRDAGTAVTPTPGGVGVLTTACLMENVCKCYCMQKQEER